jgi:phosphoserine phosphatase
MENQQIQTLKLLFKISTAAFDFKNTIITALGKTPQTTTMELLHRIALKELERDNPNAAFLDGLLFHMEQLAEHDKRESEKKFH